MERAQNHDFADLHEVAQLKQLRFDFEIPIIFVDFLFEHLHTRKRPVEAFRRTHDTDVIPHRAAQFVAIVREHDALVGLVHVPVLPLGNGNLGNGIAFQKFRNRSRAVVREHNRFEKRVRREAVRPVQARARRFAAGVKPAHGSCRIHVRFHAAAKIMRRGNDGDFFRRHVDPVRLAGVVNMRETFPQVFGGFVGNIEPNVRRSGFFHLGIDCARHDIARSEIAARVVVFHKRTSFDIAQNCAFAAHAFGNELAGTVRRVHRRRVKLHEFHVAHDRARAVRHRDSVARRDIGIGRILINLPDSAGGKHDGGSAEREHLARRHVEHVRAEYAVFRCVRRNFRIFQARRRNQVNRHVILEKRNISALCGNGEKRVLNGFSRQIVRMQNAAVRVSAFPR